MLEVITVNPVRNLELVYSLLRRDKAHIKTNKDALAALVQIFTAFNGCNRIRDCAEVTYISLR